MDIALPEFLTRIEFVETDFFEANEQVIYSAAGTALLLAVLWAARILLLRAVGRKSDVLSTDQRRWAQLVRTLIWVLIVLGLVLIWAPQLRTAALSLTAFVVAIVIATKEVILCFTGAFMRVSTAPFRMGDWITLDGVTGEVVDINPFSVKVHQLETEHGTFAPTGRIVQIPNSRYFTNVIENLSYLKTYKSHFFTVALQDETLDAADLARRLQAIAERHAAAAQDGSGATMKKIKREGQIVLPDPAPQIVLTANDFNNLKFTVRIFLPTREAAIIAGRITQDFMTEVATLRRARETQPPKEKSSGH